MIKWFPNNAAAWLFFIAFYIWAISELVNTFGSRFGPHNHTTTSALRRDKGSYWIILLIVWGSIFVSFLARALKLGVFHNDAQYIGLALMVAGVALREWAVLSLGRFFAVSVTIYSDQTLVRCGPYRWLRHPAYAGSILTLGGFPLALGTWAAGALVLVLSLTGYLYRVRIEEKTLCEAFGDEYREYMQHTWRLFPGL